MSNMHDWARRFSQSVEDGTVDKFFGEWVLTEGEHRSYPEIADGGQELVPNEPGLYLWGADRKVNGRRHIVPRYVGKAEKSLQVRFVRRKDRFEQRRGRYLLAPDVRRRGLPFPPQAWLACRFHDRIRDKVGKISNRDYVNTLKSDRGWCMGPAIMRGLKAFPRQMVDSFRCDKPGPGNDIRLRHAVDWVLHGGPDLKTLWVAFLPSIPGMEHPKALGVAERNLILAAIGWRTEHDGLPPLLNHDDREP